MKMKSWIPVVAVVVVLALVAFAWFRRSRESYVGTEYLYRVPDNMRSMVVMFTQTHFKGMKRGAVTSMRVLAGDGQVVRSMYLPPLTTVTLYTGPNFTGAASTFSENKLVLPPKRYGSFKITGPFANRQ